jgi:transposase
LNGPKRSKTQREVDRAKVAELDLCGYSQRAIAAKLGVSHQQVGYDLAKIRAGYRQQQTEARDAKVNRSIAALRHMLTELWEAWHAAKLPKERSVKENISKVADKAKKGKAAEQPAAGEIKRLKAVLTTEGRIPEPAFMKAILDVHKEISVLDDVYSDVGEEIATLRQEMEELKLRFAMGVRTDEPTPAAPPGPGQASGAA